MSEHLLLSEPDRPPLPEPQRERWQPLRMRLVELFHCNVEEFWFHDGHPLLRGNHGSGKSKVLLLAFPLPFDANLRRSRVEPDSDAGKKMAWKLLMATAPHGASAIAGSNSAAAKSMTARYLRLGVGLSAVSGRPQAESWFFLLEGDGQAPDPRIAQDLWLATADRHVLTREDLREAIGGRGLLFEKNAQGYRRAFDERLFLLRIQRCSALMDTLIQLSRPQLSKKANESGLCHAPSESLPLLPVDLIGDVAKALNQLEEDRNELQDSHWLEQTVIRCTAPGGCATVPKSDWTRTAARTWNPPPGTTSAQPMEATKATGSMATTQAWLRSSPLGKDRMRP